MRLDPFRPALEPGPVLGSDWKAGLLPDAAPDCRIAARFRRRAVMRARRVRRGVAEYPSPGVAAVDVAEPAGPIWVVLRTPVPPAGVPSELLGAVVLGVPPAGPLRALPGVTWAREGATAMAARTAAAISEVERRRDRIVIRGSRQEGQDGNAVPTCNDPGNIELLPQSPLPVSHLLGGHPGTWQSPGLSETQSLVKL